MYNLSQLQVYLDGILMKDVVSISAQGWIDCYQRNGDNSLVYDRSGVHIIRHYGEITFKVV